MNGTRTLIQGDQDLNHDQEREKKLEGEEEGKIPEIPDSGIQG